MVPTIPAGAFTCVCAKFQQKFPAYSSGININKYILCATGSLPYLYLIFIALFCFFVGGLAPMCATISADLSENFFIIQIVALS